MRFIFFKMFKHRFPEFVLAMVMVCVLVAILAVQASLSQYSENQVHDFAHKIGGNMLILSSGVELNQFFQFRSENTNIPSGYAQQLLKSKLNQHVSVAQSRLYGDVSVNGTSFIAVGDQVLDKDGKTREVPQDSVYLGSTAARKLNIKTGDRITVKANGENRQLTVLGTLDRVPDGLDTGLFMNIATAQQILKKPGEISSLRIAGCWCSLDIDKLAANVEKQLPGTKALTIKGMINAQLGMIKTVKKYSRVIYAAALIFIFLIVGMLIFSLTRRQISEIALLLVAGVRPNTVVTLFMLFAAMVGLGGGWLGYLLGMPLTRKVTMVLAGENLPVPQVNIGFLIAISILASLFAAFWPAWKASRKNPADILRNN